MKKKVLLFLIIVSAVVLLFVLTGTAVYAEEEVDLNENISNLLNDLDLSELQKYLDENEDSFLYKYGNTAEEIVEYLIHGNLNTDYGGYLNELLNILFKNVISLIPAFATVVAIALLSAVVSAAEGSILGKSTAKIVHLACYALIILIITSMLTGIIADCIASINRIKRQI